jgi:hypothetical protein
MSRRSLPECCGELTSTEMNKIDSFSFFADIFTFWNDMVAHLLSARAPACSLTPTPLRNHSATGQKLSDLGLPCILAAL